MQFFCPHTTTTPLGRKIMKVIALSVLALTTVVTASIAIAEPIKDKDALPILSMAQPMKLNDAEMDRITAGMAADITANLPINLTEVCPNCQPGGVIPVPIPCCLPIVPLPLQMELLQSPLVHKP
jgi:hypothetical protein